MLLAYLQGGSSNMRRFRRDLQIHMHFFSLLQHDHRSIRDPVDPSEPQHLVRLFLPRRATLHRMLPIDPFLF